VLFERSPSLGVKRASLAKSSANKEVAGNRARLFARLFNTDDGKAVLGSLAQDTAGRTIPLTAGPDALQRMEGRRELVAEIIELVEKGMSQ
jgi:hypothetical protein